jgi:hypothetical protein
MAMLFLEAIGPRGEELALAAGDVAGVAVGWDEELSSATFDSDLDEAELSEQVFAELDRLDTDWRSHLRVTE